MLRGPSGGGKTTLLNLIGCIDSPTGGCLKLFGKQVASLFKFEVARQQSHMRVGIIYFLFSHAPLPHFLIFALPRACPDSRHACALTSVSRSTTRPAMPFSPTCGAQSARRGVYMALIPLPSPPSLFPLPPLFARTTRGRSDCNGVVERLAKRLATALVERLDRAAMPSPENRDPAESRPSSRTPSNRAHRACLSGGHAA